MARSSRPHLVLLDNEAVQALGDRHHRKHRSALALLEVVAQRKGRGVAVDTAVPTTVRVEAGWDRTSAGAAFLNLLRIRDIALDAPLADRAARVRERARVSVVDAHLGAAIATAEADHISVLTSDTADLAAVAEEVVVTVVKL